MPFIPDFLLALLPSSLSTQIISSRLKIYYEAQYKHIQSSLNPEVKYFTDEYYTSLKLTKGFSSQFEHNDVNINSKESLLLDNLFNDAKDKLLVIGEAGIGKSTLLKYICFRWSIGKLWPDKFDVILRVDLAALYSWIKDSTTYKTYERNSIESYACFIHHAEFLGKKVTFNNILNIINSKRLLVLLDGFDELLNSSTDDTKASISEVNGMLEVFDYVITTSRPKAAEEKNLFRKGLFTKTITNEGFDEKSRLEYINNYKTSDSSLDKALDFQERNELIDFIENDIGDKKLCNVPLNVEIICFLWSDKEIRQKLQGQITKTILYKNVERKLQHWYEDKLEKIKKEFNP